MALFPVFGTWTWCNLGMGGAWQIALGLALLGETAALYFTLVRPSPFIAGAFFTLAFGNRTELLITAPFFLYLFWRRPVSVEQAPRLPELENTSSFPAMSGSSASGSNAPNGAAVRWKNFKQALRVNAPMVFDFLTLPVTLALLTGAYNLVRFHSMTDFGYFHIPEVRDEPWCMNTGCFRSTRFRGTSTKCYSKVSATTPTFRSLVFRHLGAPFFSAVRSFSSFLGQAEGIGSYRGLRLGLVTFVLWCHGNPGGWQFSYRYAMILLPWMFLLLTGNGPPKITVTEISLFAVSIAINGTATWLFLWTDEIQP